MNTAMITVVCNGEAVTVPAKTTVQGYLLTHRYRLDCVAVEADGRILTADEYSVTPLIEGMHLEVVSFVGGG